MSAVEKSDGMPVEQVEQSESVPQPDVAGGKSGDSPGAVPALSGGGNRNPLALVVVGLIVAAVVLIAAFIVSGFYFRPGVPRDFGAPSPAICGPLTDQYGNPAGNAGPCHTAPPLPEVLEWKPFWAH